MRIGLREWACGFVLLHGVGWSSLGWAQDDEEDLSDQELVVEAPERVRKGAGSASRTVVLIDDTLATGQDLAGALARVPGTSIRRAGGLGAWSGVSIRGSTFRQVLVAIDGLPLNPDGTGAVDLSTLPLAAFERVEVVRGSAPVRYGAAPMGGVVDLHTQSSSSMPVHLTAGIGSWETGRWLGSVGAQTGGAVPMAVFGAFDGFRTSGAYPYLNDQGTPYDSADDAIQLRQNNDKQQWSGVGRWSIGGARTRLTMQDIAFARDEGLPGPIGLPGSRARLSTFRNIGSLRLESRGGNRSGEARLWHFIREEVYDDRAGQLGVGEQLQRDRNQSVGMGLFGQMASTSWLSTGLAVHGRWDQFQQENRLTDEATRPVDRLSLSTSVEAGMYGWGNRVLVWPALTMTAAHSALKGSEPESFVSVGPRVGVQVHPVKGVELWANAGQFFRPPDFYELYGDRGSVVGNPNLVPESGWQGDVGIGLLLPVAAKMAVRLEAVGFAKDNRNGIFYVQNAQRTMVPVNFGHSRVMGLEMAVDGGFEPWLNTQTRLTYTHSANLDDRPAVYGNQLPRLPRWTAHHTTTIRVWDAVTVGHSLDFASGSYWDATNWYPNPPRVVQGAFLRFRPNARAPALEISILNLGNRTVELQPRNPLDTSDGVEIPQAIADFTGHPLPGRTVLVSWSWTGGRRGGEP